MGGCSQTGMGGKKPHLGEEDLWREYGLTRVPGLDSYVPSPRTPYPLHTPDPQWNIIVRDPDHLASNSFAKDASVSLRIINFRTTFNTSIALYRYEFTR